MYVRRKTSHICADDGNDGLCAGIPYIGHILDAWEACFSSGFMKLFHHPDFDVDVDPVQMCQELLHHPMPERAHHTIEVVCDLLLDDLEIMGDNLLFRKQAMMSFLYTSIPQQLS